MEIEVDYLESDDVIGLLQEHLQDMHATSPPESVHALDVNGLKSPEITFFRGTVHGQLVGCIAIKHLENNEAEIKSMRIANEYRGHGYARQLLTHIIEYSKTLNLTRLNLETGSQTFFDPARALYFKFGFKTCLPFADYKADPNSHFMSLILD
ncbi:GNAT family N-acetyltransferase [Alteromonas sp. 5E99-2]|uniref:GNAT family N-acetyltransferase n=1 Tax=Alteromonas sp. 5E99-2 TaxID=2817683 RepID=UPI001A999D56|nr:GNAT family N-acetyltransferase [Alteromonas sp. 5E99-2]MBO1254951.1 GNAT family N-acetyltransferase [Alteromonas sp. 5E99-2]